MKELSNRSDWHWYKQGIDVRDRTPYRHFGEPEKYPCRVVESRTEENCRHDDCYHEFLYQQGVECSECGHVTIVWPEIEEEEGR